MTSVAVRILLRYLAAMLVARGLMSQEVGGLLSTDPEIAMAVEIGAGVAIAALVEGWYWIAKRFGWAT